jgi:hypothetical protein
MNPAMLLLIIQGVQAAVAAAPQVVDLAVKAKDFIASLFSGGPDQQGPAGQNPRACGRGLRRGIGRAGIAAMDGGS